MSTDRPSVFWGGLMVIAGILWLLGNLGILGASPVWPVLLFGTAGLGFAYAFVASRASWWAAIPAGAFLGLAALIAWSELTPVSINPRGETADEWGASLFLGGLGIGFWAVYLRQRAHWWAIIPGGVLLTLAVFIGLTPLIPGEAVVAPLFFGLALTFGILAAVPTHHGYMRWPLIPAGVLGLLAVVFATGATWLLNALQYAWPLVLVAVGLYLLWSTLGQRWRHAPRT